MPVPQTPAIRYYCQTMTDQPVLCLVRDLLFYSKIRAAAESAGVALKSLRDPGQLIDQKGSGLIVDLNQPLALKAAQTWREHTGGLVAGFVSHVDTETIQAARLAGIDRILVRSQFEAESTAAII